MSDLLGRCTACEEREAVYHLTVRVTVYGPKTERVKLVSFALCEECEMSNRQIFCDDGMFKRRVALRMVHDPSFYSKYPEWRGKKLYRAGSQSQSVAK
jgi:hypothetical protein